MKSNHKSISASPCGRERMRMMTPLRSRMKEDCPHIIEHTNYIRTQSKH
jgi:hypothetical protein